MMQPFQETLDKTITKIKNNRMLLPDFQREFVWKDEEDQCKLIASVLTKMPIGSILLLKSKDAKEYACKSLGSKKYIEEKNLPKGDVEFLLDGQQRLTVLSNVFSDVIFNLSEVSDLIAPMSLKRRFFLALPRYEEEKKKDDLFGLNKLEFPLDKPDNDDPSFQSFDVLQFLRVLTFSKNSTVPYNPYYKNSTKLSKLESFCQNAEPDYYYIPLFLLIDNGKTKLYNTTLTRIINEIAKNVVQAKVNSLAALIDADPAFDKETYIKANVIEDAYNEYFDTSCYKNGNDEVLEEYNAVLNIQADGWASNMLLYLKSCVAQINLSQISLEDSQRARAIDIYENLNRGGISLDIYDLLMARVTLANKRPYSLRIRECIDSDAIYPQMLIHSPGVLKDFKKLGKYKASVSMGCYNKEKNEFLKNYLEAFLNVLSLLSYRPSFSEEEYTIDLLKRDKKLSLSPQQIDKNCEPTCNAIDRACFFFQARCGIRKFKELNYILMVPVVAYILSNDECYSKGKNDEIFNLLEAWYWANIFSGHLDRDQNTRIITDLNLLVKAVIKILDCETPDLGWLTSREQSVLNIPNYSDKPHLLMQNAVNEEYPKAILSTAICQYYLSFGYNDLVKDNDGNLKHLSVFADGSEKYQMHHVIPLGADCTVAESTDRIRNDKKHLLNSPLNKIFITSSANNKISSMPLDAYSKLIPIGASLTSLDFVSNDIDINSTDSEKRNLLEKRFNGLRNKLIGDIDSLII